MPAPAADQDSFQDAFLQPEVSHSSPIRRRGRSHGHLPPAAASADLSSLVKDYNALSARCRASEQQLAQARRELSKERQRSRQLRASYDALTLSSLHPIEQLHQHRASTEALPGMSPVQSPDSNPAHQVESHRIISESPTHTNSSSNHSSQEDVGLHGRLQLPRAAARAPAVCLPLGPLMAGAAAHRAHRWSTDTRVADQARSSATSTSSSRSSTSSSIAKALSSCQEGSPAAQHLQPSAGQPAAAVAPAAAAAAPAAEDAPGPDGQASTALVDGIQGAALAAASKRSSPLKRAAQDQQQQPSAASPCSSGSASPKKHKQLPPQSPNSSSRVHQQQQPIVADTPLGTLGDVEVGVVQAAAQHEAAQQGQQQAGQQQQQGPQHGEQQEGQQHGPQQQQQQGQQPRQVSKRPAEQLWSQAEQQPGARATRRLRTTGGNSSSEQAGLASSDAAECSRQPAADAGVPLEHQQQQTAAVLKAAAAGDGSSSNPQPATVPMPPSSGGKKGPARLPLAPVSRSQMDSQCEPVAGTADSPAVDADTATAAAAAPAPAVAAAAAAEPAVGLEQHVSHPVTVAGGSSGSSYRPSRLSASSNTACTTLAIVPVPGSSSNSRRSSDKSSRRAAPQHSNRYSSARYGRAQFDASDADSGCQSDIPEEGPPDTPDTSGHQSYGRRAAKAAKAVAKKLRNLFIGSSSGTGGSSGVGSNAGSHGAPPAAGGTGGGRGSNASSSSGRDSDFRRSWQGPFFSSGSAARAAEQQGPGADSSRDDSHAERKGSKGKRWKAPKWARKYSGYSSDSSSDCGEGDPMFDEDPFGPGFSPLRHNFAQRHPQHKQQGTAAGPGESPFRDPFGPAFSPLRQSMGLKPSGQQQDPAAAAADDNNGFGPDWLGID